MDHLSSPASTPCALCLHSCRRPQLLVAKITCNFCCASAPLPAVPSLDDSQITQENRETAETELVEGEKGLLLPSSSFSRRRSTGLDLSWNGCRYECNPSLYSRSRVKDVAETTSLCVGGGHLRLDARIGGGAGRRQQKGQK